MAQILNPKSNYGGLTSDRGLRVQAGVYAPSSPQQLLQLAAIINGNSHGVSAQDSHNTDVGVGLFPATAMLNHSCRPNCSYTVAGACVPRDLRKFAYECKKACKSGGSA